MKNPEEPYFYKQTILSKHARKPQAFKPGDEWHHGVKPALAGGTEAFSGIIWLWPGMGRGHIQNIGFYIT